MIDSQMEVRDGLQWAYGFLNPGTQEMTAPFVDGGEETCQNHPKSANIAINNFAFWIGASLAIIVPFVSFHILVAFRMPGPKACIQDGGVAFQK